MFDYVEDARVVCGRRLEGYGKGLVVVVARDPQRACTAVCVAHDEGGAVELG